MLKKELYRQFLQYDSAYKKLHSRTADIDIAIILKLFEGKSVVRIAIEIPCAEATVYRAIKRVEKFIMEEAKPCADVRLLSCCEKEKT